MRTFINEQRAITAGGIMLQPHATSCLVKSCQHRYGVAECGRPTTIQSPWHLSDVVTDQAIRCAMNMGMVAQGAAKECRHSERGDTWTVEILKSGHACANAHEWNVDLACRVANVMSGHQVDSAVDKRRSDAMMLWDSMLKDRELLAWMLDNIRAWSDAGKQQMLSSMGRVMMIRLRVTTQVDRACWYLILGTLGV